MYKHILIATDGSEFARKGVDHGLSLAKTLGAKVSVVTVVETWPAYGMGIDGAWAASPTVFEEFRKTALETAEKSLADVTAAAKKIGVDIDTVLVENQSPATGIVDTADEKDCSLIVMASHGRRGVSRLLLGSQATEVLSSSKVPVLIIK
ncbi:MAG: universal stress protein [Phyllobacterium sp.]